MTNSDIISICNIAATVVAVVAAPIIALIVNGKLQQRANTKQQQLQLLSILLSLRHQPLSPDALKALNLIDAVFVDNTDVREAWSKYFSSLSDPALNTSLGFSIREEKKRDLIMAIIGAIDLKKKISTSDILRTYTPAAVMEADYLATWERIKRREDLRAEFIRRGIGFPDFAPIAYPPLPPQPAQTTPPQ